MCYSCLQQHAVQPANQANFVTACHHSRCVPETTVAIQDIKKASAQLKLAACHETKHKKLCLTPKLVTADGSGQTSIEENGHLARHIQTVYFGQHERYMK